MQIEWSWVKSSTSGWEAVFELLRIINFSCETGAASNGSRWKEAFFQRLTAEKFLKFFIANSYWRRREENVLRSEMNVLKPVSLRRMSVVTYLHLLGTRLERMLWKRFNVICNSKLKSSSSFCINKSIIIIVIPTTNSILCHRWNPAPPPTTKSKNGNFITALALKALPQFHLQRKW